MEGGRVVPTVLFIITIIIAGTVLASIGFYFLRKFYDKL